MDNLKKCYNFYIKKLPIIVIYTQSDNQEDADKMIKYIEEQMNSFKDEEDEENIKILKILAEDKKNDNGVIKAFGISNLMKITSESVKKGIESSCIESLIEKGVKILKDEFEENINDLKKSIFNELNLSDLDVKEGFDIINEIIIKDEDPVTINQNFDFQKFY